MWSKSIINKLVEYKSCVYKKLLLQMYLCEYLECDKLSASLHLLMRFCEKNVSMTQISVSQSKQIDTSSKNFYDKNFLPLRLKHEN